MLHVKVEHYGEAVRAERERRNLSQVEAAAEIGVSERTLQAWENEGVTPWPRHRRAILAWLEEREAA